MSKTNITSLRLKPKGWSEPPKWLTRITWISVSFHTNTSTDLLDFEKKTFKDLICKHLIWPDHGFLSDLSLVQH